MATIQAKKFPIRQEVVPTQEEVDQQEFRTRSGYLPKECFKSLETSMLESGTIATGRSLHFAADLVCSGGLTVFLQLIWDFAIRHIGIASPRVFVYLKKRMDEMDELCKKYADDDIIQLQEFQTRITELIFVLRECPRRGRIVPPKVGVETHRDGWLGNVASATETQALRKVYKPGSDLGPLRQVGCEFLKAVSDGAFEKALFWIQWTIEEEHRTKKEHGTTLSTVDRGPPHMKGKTKTDVLYFFVDLCAEAYKDFAAQGNIRMHEEFQCLLNLLRGADSRLGIRYRKDLLFICVQILCEVPRWKVPAAPTLIKDPVSMSRAIQQSGSFFREVLSNPKVSLYGKGKAVFKGGKLSENSKHKLKNTNTIQNHLDAYERAMEEYMKQ